MSEVYSDRAILPSETLARISPHLTRYGITRLARQTSFDTIGLPVFASIRPNSATLATNHGKGLDEDAAKASAAMEGLEYAIAEQPECPIERATLADLSARGQRVYTSTRSLPLGASFPKDQLIDWTLAEDALAGDPIWVPLDLVSFGRRADLLSLCQHTNGLASGNTRDEAVFHAVCELIERDAGTMWALVSAETRESLQIDPATLDDPEVSRLVLAITAAGHHLSLYNITSDIGVPVISAEIYPASDSPRLGLLHEVASGAGAHPVAARAALRAITEAAQSRITAISGARDDISASEYVAKDRTASPAADQRTSAPSGLPLGTPLKVLLDDVLQRLRQLPVCSLPIVNLGGSSAGITVVRVLCAELEDWGVNRNWRPSKRALGWLVAP